MINGYTMFMHPAATIATNQIAPGVTTENAPFGSTNTVPTNQRLETLATTNYVPVTSTPPSTYDMIHNNQIVYADYLNFMGLGGSGGSGGPNQRISGNDISNSTFLSLKNDGQNNAVVNSTPAGFYDPTTDSNFVQGCFTKNPALTNCYTDLSTAAGDLFGTGLDEYITATAIMTGESTSIPTSTINIYKWNNTTHLFDNVDTFTLNDVFVTSMITQDFNNTGINDLVIGGYNFTGITPNLYYTSPSNAFPPCIHPYMTGTQNCGFYSYPYDVWVVSYAPSGIPITNASQRTTLVNGAEVGQYLFSIGTAIDSGQIEPYVFGNSTNKVVYGTSVTSITPYSKYALLSFGPTSFTQYLNTYSASTFSYDIVSAQFVNIGTISGDMGRPIYADFNNNGQDTLVVPDSPYDPTSTPPQPPSTGSAGYIYTFNATNDQVGKYWIKEQTFPYFGPIGAGRITGNETDIVAFTTPDSCVNWCGTIKNIPGHNYNGYLVIYSKTQGDLLAGKAFEPTLTNSLSTPYYATGKLVIADINQDGMDSIIFPYMRQGDVSGTEYADPYMAILSWNSTYQLSFFSPPQPQAGCNVPGNVGCPYPTAKESLMYDNCFNVFMGYGWADDDTSHNVLQRAAQCPSINAKITVGDFFGWSLKARYTGQPAFETIARPTIISVISAPPMVQYSSQNFGNSYTEFGMTTSSSSSSTTSSSMTTSGHLAFGYTESLGIDVLFVGTTATSLEVTSGQNWQQESSTSATTTTQTDISNIWAADPSSDGVVFSATTYINYNYTIVTSPNPLLLGTSVIVSLPIHTDVIKTDVNFFEQLTYNQPQYQHLLDHIPYMNHTVGNPTTYPSYNEINQTLIKEDEQSTNPVLILDPSVQKTVGEGGYVDTLQYQLSKLIGNEQEWNTESGTTTHVHYTLGGFALDSEHTFDRGSGGKTSVTLGSGTIFTAAIGQFDAQEWANYRYNYGFFIYNYYDPVLKQNYFVVNFYTGNFGSLLAQGILPTNPNPNSGSPQQVIQQAITTLTSQPATDATTVSVGTIGLLYTGKNALTLLKKLHQGA